MGIFGIGCGVIGGWYCVINNVFVCELKKNDLQLQFGVLLHSCVLCEL